MPYLSKAKQERARWMTLREALVHIKTVEDCNLSGYGSVLDDQASRSSRIRLKLIGEGRLHYRPLMVLREDVLRNWGGQSAEKLSNRKSAPATKVGKRGRPSVRDLVRKTLDSMRSVGCDFNLPQKRLAEAVAHENGGKLGERGWSERAIVKHVSDWLKENGYS